MKIAILGGTGDEGFGLAFRWAAAGHEVIIGSRNAEKGFSAAADLQEKLPEGAIGGSDNLTAARLGEIVVLAVPYAAQSPTLHTVREALRGKILITVVVPTGEKKGRAWRLPSGLSAAEEAQKQLGEDVRVVAAFQNIAARPLLDLTFDQDCDVLVCGNKGDDKQVVLQLCRDARLHGVNSGALQNARAVEELASVLIAINVIHKIKGAGIRITGLPDAEQ